jgi:hypothetical protein
VVDDETDDEYSPPPPWSRQAVWLYRILRKPKHLPSLETQFQPVNGMSDPAVIEMVNEAMRAHFYAPANKPQLTKPTEVQSAIRGLKVGKDQAQTEYQIGP